QYPATTHPKLCDSQLEHFSWPYLSGRIFARSVQMVYFSNRRDSRYGLNRELDRYRSARNHGFPVQRSPERLPHIPVQLAVALPQKAFLFKLSLTFATLLAFMGEETTNRGSKMLAATLKHNLSTMKRQLASLLMMGLVTFGAGVANADILS